MSQQYTDVMVDLETTGTDPEHAAIIQLTAVRFNLTTREIDHEWFNECLLVPPNRFWSEDTLRWWQRHPEVLRDIQVRMRDPAEVMAEFYKWANGCQDSLHFWSKPLSFDFPFLASYCRTYGWPNPYDFRKGRDVRTYLWATNPNFDESAVPFIGPAHNALFDVLHQIRLLYAAPLQQEELG